MSAQQRSGNQPSSQNHSHRPSPVPSQSQPPSHDQARRTSESGSVNQPRSRASQDSRSKKHAGTASSRRSGNYGTGSLKEEGLDIDDLINGDRQEASRRNTSHGAVTSLAGKP